MRILREDIPRPAPLLYHLDRVRVVTLATMGTAGPSRELNTIIMQLQLTSIMGETLDKAAVGSSMQEVLAAPTLAGQAPQATLNCSQNN